MASRLGLLFQHRANLFYSCTKAICVYAINKRTAHVYPCIEIFWTTNVQLKISESAPVVPSTSMAAHPVDTEVEIEPEDKIEMVGKASGNIEEGAAYENVSFSLPLPPPPIPKNNYSQVIIVSGCLLTFLLMHFLSLNKNILRGMRICSQCRAACISLFLSIYFGFWSSPILHAVWGGWWDYRRAGSWLGDGASWCRLTV